MKNCLCLLGLLAAMPLAAAESKSNETQATNAPATTNELAFIPDPTHRPVLVTNAVTIAGERTPVVETHCELTSHGPSLG